MCRGGRDRPNPCLIFAQDWGSNSSRCGRGNHGRGHGRGLDSSRGKGDGWWRGKGPHTRPIAVPTAGLGHSWTWKGMEERFFFKEIFWDEDLKK